MTELPPHLGGQMGGNVDIGLMTAIRDKFAIKSLVDIGCGNGGAAIAYADLGLRVHGIDGDWTRLPEDPRFTLHDFTQGPIETMQADLAYSVEFLEHVEERYIENYMPAFMGCRYAVVTAARPGQGGHHHVNCKPSSYWIETFKRWGLIYMPAETERLKRASTMCKMAGPNTGKIIPYFKRTGLFFYNERLA